DAISPTLMKRFVHHLAMVTRGLTPKSAPVPEYGGDQRECGDRGGVGAQDARPEREPHHIGRLEQSSALVLRKSAFRPDQDREPHRCRRTRRRKRGDRVSHLGVLVAEPDQPPPIAGGQHAGEPKRRRNLRQRQDAALFGGLDGVRPHPLEIDARHLGMPGQHRHQARRAHFDRLLHHVVEARLLKRREQVVEVESWRLRARSLADRERKRAFDAVSQGGPPFAVAAVEHEHRIAALEAEHIAQVMGLHRVEREPSAIVEWGIHVEPWGAKVVAWHGAVSDPLCSPGVSQDRPIHAGINDLPCYRPIQKPVNINGGAKIPDESVEEGKAMTVYRTLPLAALLVAAPFAASAQFGGMPGMPGTTPGGVPGFGGPPQAPPAVCQQLLAMRDETQKYGLAIQKANQRKVPVQEACRLFKSYLAGDQKFIKAIEGNAATSAH